MSGLWTKKGVAWLRQLALPTVSQELRRDLLRVEFKTFLANCDGSNYS
jgi:hypothetical protein